MSQGQLPPGWSAQWDAQAGQYLYIDSQTNTSQWEPPSAVPTPSSPPVPAPASSGTPTGLAAGGAAHGPKRRQYPTAQIAEQYGSMVSSPAPPPITGPGAGYSTNGYPDQSQGISQDPAYATGYQAQQQTGPQLFTPGMPNQQPVAPGQGAGGVVPGVAGAAYFSQPGPEGAQAPGYPQQQQPQQYAGQAGPQGYAGAPQQGGAGVAGLAGQFGQMGMGDKMHMSSGPTTVNLIGMQPNVLDLESPPPEIRLPPGASCTNSPKANAHYSYHRSTMNAVPATPSLLNKTKIPLASILTPFRSHKEGDDPVPVVEDAVIARCRRCRAYIHPFVAFIDNGNRWKCTMCNLSNEVPQLFDWDPRTNQPADRWSRPELNHGVVDFVAPKEYMVRPPQPPVYVFVIDVSQNAIQSGMVATAARTILESLDRMPNEDKTTKFGLIAVSTSLHFFSLPPGEGAEPAMLVVSDLDDVYLPKPVDLLVNLTESRPAIESILSRLNDMFKDNLTVGSALGPAMRAAYQLIGTIGGKIVTLTACLPTLGEGALKARDDPKLLGTAKESTLLQSASAFYKTFAIDCSKNQITVDMYLFSPAYTDVASLRCLPRYTAGQVYYYPGFNAARSEDAIKFAHEFANVLASPIGLEAVIRVRGTRGLRLSAFWGNFFVRSTDLLALPTIPIDQSYTIEMQIDDPLTQPFVVIQCGMLHTTHFGERRIRVTTIALPTTGSMSEVFASVDPNALFTLLSCRAVERATTNKLEDARDAVFNKLVDILGVYKNTMTSAGSGASAQLAVPDNMKMLPLLCCALIKHLGFRESSQIPPDLRAYAHALLSTLPTQSLIPYVHPRFYALHSMPDDAGTVGENGIIFPPALNLTSERLQRHGFYMIEDGQTIFLWVGNEAVPQLIMDVFDLPSYQELKGGKYTLPVLDNPYSLRINNLIAKTRELRRNPYWQHVYVVKADAEPALRNWALSLLIEDKVERSASYAQFLSLLKDKVS